MKPQCCHTKLAAASVAVVAAVAVAVVVAGAGGGAGAAAATVRHVDAMQLCLVAVICAHTRPLCLGSQRPMG